MDLSGILKRCKKFARRRFWVYSSLFSAFVVISSACSTSPESFSINNSRPVPITLTFQENLEEFNSVSELESSTPTFTAHPTDKATTIPSLPTRTTTEISGVTPELAVEANPTLSPTFPPTPALLLEATKLPTATFTPAPSPTVSVAYVSVNGISQEEIIIFPNNARQNVRELFTYGQTLGRNPNAFSKLGDSVTLTDHFLTRFDSGYYVLGSYEFLQPTIDHFSGSFARYGVATKVGLHAWSIFDPLWANKDWCLPDEHMVACEIRLFNPSIMLIKIGSNDNGAAEAFDQNVRNLVIYLINNGVVPVLATKADRFEGPDDRNNTMIRQIAEDYSVPLWDFDRVAGTMPRRGLSGDDVHMTMADADDYTDPKTFERGYPVSDLTALMMLDAIWQEVKDISGP